MKNLKVAKEIIANFPESAMCFRCVGWESDGKDSYKNIWIAPDDEGLEEEDYIIPLTEVETRYGKDKVYVITPAMIAEAYPSFIKAWKDKGWGFYGAEANDRETWDGCVHDAVIQFVMFGDVIMS